MSSPATLFDVRPPLAFLTFNRPEARNAMTWAMYDALVAACEQVDANPEVRAFVLKGAGGQAFVSGTDISQFQSFREPKDGIEYEKRISLKGWRRRPGGAHVTLTETVRQDHKQGLTIFDQEFTERRGGKTQSRTFSLAFRTLSVPQVVRRLEKAGFEITALLGDYRGREWDPRADVWVILARKR